MNTLLAKVEHGAAQFNRMVGDYFAFFKNKQNMFEGKYKYIVKSDIGIRFIAAIIDVLIEAGLSVPAIAFYMLGVAGFTTNSLGYPVHRSLPIFFILSFFAYFIPIIYMLIKDGIGEGQSFGKK